MINKTRGFSIIEIMLSLTFGVFILASCIEVYLTVKANYKIQHDLSTLQANGRLLTYVFQQIKSPLDLHGYTSLKPPDFLKGQHATADILVTNDVAQTAYYLIGSKHALFVKTRGKPREELILHVNNLQIIYGVICPAKERVCSYLPATEVLNWGLVKSALLTVQFKVDNIQRNWSIYIAT